jgi:hypothetical protein
MLGQVIKSGPVVQIRDGNGNVSVLKTMMVVRKPMQVHWR